jgi:3-carboxy-cis,cis-muconate cycloisomerase
MPQKNNPMRSEQILAAARAVAGHVAPLMGALVQEHERGTHGWQLEWLSLSPMLLLAAGAASNARALFADLVVYPERMRANLLSNHGLSLAEPAVLALSEHLPRPEASALVTASAARALAESRSLVEVVREAFEEKHGAGRVDFARLANPELQLGNAHELLDAALSRISAELEA